MQFSPAADAIRRDAERILIGIEQQLEARIGKTAYKGLKQALNRNWGPVAIVAPER